MMLRVLVLRVLVTGDREIVAKFDVEAASISALLDSGLISREIAGRPFDSLVIYKTPPETVYGGLNVSCET